MDNDLVKLTLRLPRPLALALGDAAHRQRLPLAVFTRQLLQQLDLQQLAALPGAPPAIAELPPAARRLAQILAGITSNLTQISSAAQAAGAPAAGLAALQMLARRVQLALVAAQAGEILIEPEQLEEPAAALNAAARAINGGTALQAAGADAPLRTLGQLLPQLPSVDGN